MAARMVGQLVAMMVVHSVASWAEHWDDYLVFCLVARTGGLMVVDSVVRKAFLMAARKAVTSAVR